MLEHFQFLQNLSPHQIQLVEQSCQLRTYAPGALIIREGEYTDELYFLLAGQVALHKQEPTSGEQVAVKQIDAGHSFGEISFVSGAPRSASIQAVTAVTAYVLRKGALFQRSADAAAIVARMEQQFTHTLTENLRTLDNRYSTALYQQVETLKARQRFSYFFVVLILILFSSSIFSLAFQRFFADYDRYSRTFNWIYLLVAILIPLLLFLGKIELSLAEIGVTWQRWRPALRDGLLFAALSWVLFALLLSQLNPGASVASLTQGLAEPLSWSYLAHSFLQEFVRATTQVSIQRFFAQSRQSYAIVLAAIIAANVHSYFGLEAVLVTLIGSLIFGWIYSRTNNLIGVTIVHFLTGWMAFNLGLL